MAWLGAPAMPLASRPVSFLCPIRPLRPHAGILLLAMHSSKRKGEEERSEKKARLDGSFSPSGLRGQSWDRPFLQKAAGRIGLLKEQGARHRVLLPKNLGSFQNLSELLGLFEELMLRGMEKNIFSSDAVAAMNHLKRLQKQTRGDRVLQGRLETVMLKLGKVVK
eukprot:766744-Hanusia_phi.AAC.1